MAEKLQLPLDTYTVDGLQRLGRDLLRSRVKREAFLNNREEVMASYGLQNVDVSKIDEQVIEMLADPAFSGAIEKGNFQEIQSFINNKLADRLRVSPEAVGIFDFDFDVEVEVEVVAVAIAVFDFAASKTRIPDAAELQRRREIVAQAFESLGGRIGP